MLSIIIQEHEESEFVGAMLEQVAALPLKKETIIVSSRSLGNFYRDFDDVLDRFSNLDIRVFGNIHACGLARNVGGIKARYSNLLFMDAHVCFSPLAVTRLLATLQENPDACVGPAVGVGEFPACTSSGGGTGYGVAFKFVDAAFQWIWVQPASYNSPSPVPTVCGCAFAMRKATFKHLLEYGGFLYSEVGLGFEEEFGFRLWRIGHPVLSEPRAKVLHYFKAQMGHKNWDQHSVAGHHESRIAGVYLDVFDPELFEHIKNLCIQKWGKRIWNENLEKAQQKYAFYRKKLEPFKDTLEERWFFRTE